MLSLTTIATACLITLLICLPAHSAADPADTALRVILRAEPMRCDYTEGCSCASYNQPSSPYAKARACPAGGGKIAFLAWDASGNKVEEGEFIGVVKHGPWVDWHTNGVRASESRFDRGKQIGPFKAWHDNGKIAIVGQFHDGKPHGSWLHYASNGSLKNRQVWEKGVLVFQRER